MAQADLIRRVLDAGSDFSDQTQKSAEKLVQSLVDAGEVQRDQAQKLVQDLVDRSRRNRERLLTTIEREVQASVSRMGLATQADIQKLERKLARLEAPAKKAPAKKAAAKKSPAKKAAAKKSPASPA